METTKYKINNLKLKIHDYFLMENLLNNLMKISVKYFVMSINFNDIYYGNKNPEQLKICVLICILLWLMTFSGISFVLSDELYSFIDCPCFPGHFRTILLLTGFSSIAILVAKTDIILAEIKSNLNEFKIFYYLMNDIKSEHKLSKANNEKLAVLCRIIQILVMNYGLKFGIIFGSFIIIKYAIEFKILFFQLTIIILPIPFLIIYVFTAASIFFIFVILFYYYKLLFDQISDQFKLISNRKSLVINKIIEKKLIQLIYEHKSASIEINKINLSIRRTAACIFILFSFAKIISLYLFIYSNDIIIRFVLMNAIVASVIFGYAMTYFFSLQIESAHKSYKSVHSIVCKYKMRFNIKLKVS